MRCLRYLVLPLLLPIPHAIAASSAHNSIQQLDVRSPARIVTDIDGIPHIFAKSEIDMAYLQGYVHARDRLFQMDVSRRRGDGTLAELLGPGTNNATLSSDVMIRTIGLRRAAERSLAMASREMRAALTAYAAGVNAYASTHTLPPEYEALELTRFRPWTEVDSVTIIESITFSLSGFDDIDRTLRLTAYQAAGTRRGFNGTALYFGDTDRTEPFDQAATVPDALQPRPARKPPRRFDEAASMDLPHLDSSTLELAHDFLRRLRQTPLGEERHGDRGSNAWAVSGRLSVSGQPLLAGDPHLPLVAPATWYQVHLEASAADINVIGVSFAGVPYVILGNNERVAWTATSTQLDAVDAYAERLVPDATSPSGLSTVYQGNLEHVISLPQSFHVNTRGDGVSDNLSTVSDPAIPTDVLIVPRRNDGPIVNRNLATGAALSVQWGGFSGTRELDTFRGLNRARNKSEFERALQNFDVGAQNFVYVDTSGNIAYFLAAEVPIREDLQAGAVVGAPPSLIRNGQGGNEWVKATSIDRTRSSPFEILPAAEMPRLVNPPRGFLVTANNDPTGAIRDGDAFNQMRPGGGIFYLGGSFFDMGVRAGRIDELLEAKVKTKGRLSSDDMKDIQSDTIMNEARFFTPAILNAFANARKPGADAALAQAASDPRVVEAVDRLSAWDQSTPTGIREGFDANDRPGRLREPDAQEIRDSVAATIYSVWRNQFLRNTIVATLTRNEVPRATSFRDLLGSARNLIDSFDLQQGIGASGLNFFDVPGIADATTRRDLVILRSLSDALDRLAGAEYADAFQRSTTQDDYRWGRLHRVMLDHPLGSPFSTPPASGAFPAPLGPSLPGIPVDGGVVSVDVSNNALLIDNPAAFIVRNGPSTRFVARARIIGRGFDTDASLPGGESGVPGSPFLVNLLETWLTNETRPLRQSALELAGNTTSVEIILPRK
ncbi:MAG TPA: penicillin acylase family protein [Steroidobacteraceae bacterium]|nr:penicillin acylase family protein [Steroidobacteraceae bacterium]